MVRKNALELCLDLLPLGVPQQPPQNLSTGTLRNNIHEIDPAVQPLVPRQLARNELGNVGGGGFVVLLRVLEHAEGFRELAGAFVGNWDHGSVGDERVRQKEPFKFGGSDLEKRCRFSDEESPEPQNNSRSQPTCSPLTLINSLIRSTMYQYPSASTLTTSPV